jgi:UDP-N-acetylmuramoylalanine--D-glutamate ligase
MNLNDLKNKRIAILWFWKEGQSSLRFLLSEGIMDITVLDKNEINNQDEDITYITDESYLDTLWSFDIILKSPWISPFGEKLLSHREKFVSQTQIFFANYTGKVIGITGTKWKSTISTLLNESLISAGYDVILAWNIGLPVLDEIDFNGKIHDYVIYELSSYMLQDFIPDLYVGFLNNIYPCHLDWHFDSFNIYREAKVNILRKAETKILSWDLAWESEIVSIKGEKTFFDSKGRYNYDKKSFFIGSESIYSGEVKLLWEHNRKNISWIIAILDHILKDKYKIHAVLEAVLPSFMWLPNRIEDIWTYEGIRFINDAIATTPESTIAAINTFGDDLQTLFLWGEDSGFNFDTLRETILASSIQNIIAFPDTSEKIFPEINMRDYEQAFEIEIAGKSIQIIKTRSMKSAVDFAYKTTFSWKIALLSCAAPSFSLWNSYLDKATEFKKEVKQY